MQAKGLIKILLSALMVLLVFKNADLAKLRSTISSIPLSTALIVICGYTLGQILSSFKWWNILKAGGIGVPYLRVLKAYFIGMFVNCFGLGMVGGDVARGIIVAQGLPKKTEGVASVLADRIHGLAVLSCIALVTSALLGNDRVDGFIILSLALLTLGFILGWIVGPILLTHTPILRNTKFATKMKQVAAIFPRDTRTLLTITIISVVFHIVQISLHAAMASGVGATIPWATLFIVIPLVNIASSLPISWNGLGVREKSYTYFLTAAPAIVTNEQAIAFGALWLMAMTVTSAIGGIVALCSGELGVLRGGSSPTPNSSPLPQP